MTHLSAEKHLKKKTNEKRAQARILVILQPKKWETKLDTVAKIHLIL